jgi:LysR family glycine cleavage system transcriptional activator
MRLPPPNALRAFEAAARHESFARAADELHVTQGAVSRHVKILEDHLGVALFRRRAQGVELTAPGRTLLPELTASFKRIARIARQIALSEGELRVAAGPTFASRWLVRRLPAFLALHPQVRVTMGLMCGYDDFRRGGFDLGITTRCCLDGSAEGVELLELRQEALAPVCSPVLLSGRDPLRAPADVELHILLHPTSDRQDWRKWLAAAGLPDRFADRGQVFQTLDLATSAAVGGLGVAMADLHLVEEELADGRLVAPFDVVVHDGTGYVLLAEQGRLAEPRLAVFRDWLLAELATQDGAAPARPLDQATAGSGGRPKRVGLVIARWMMSIPSLVPLATQGRKPSAGLGLAKYIMA